MRQWEAKAAEHFTASGKALQQVSEASAAGDEAALRSGCRQLHDANTVGLQRDLPTPDPRLTEELQRMIDDINTATHACVRFVLAREDVDAATYQDYLARAVEHLHCGQRDPRRRPGAEVISRSPPLDRPARPVRSSRVRRLQPR